MKSIDQLKREFISKEKTMDKEYYIPRKTILYSSDDKKKEVDINCNKTCEGKHDYHRIMTSMLCKQINSLIKSDNINLIHKDVLPWWNKHLEVQERQKAAERERIKKEEFKKQALMKLNVEERKILGLDRFWLEDEDRRRNENFRKRVKQHAN